MASGYQGRGGYRGRGGYKGQWKGRRQQGMQNSEPGRGDFEASTSGFSRDVGERISTAPLNSSSMSTNFTQVGPSNNSMADNSMEASSKARWIQKDEGFSTPSAKKEHVDEFQSLRGDSERRLNQSKVTLSQARLRATFYPKFENEKSDQEIRLKMIDVVQSGMGVLEVSLKHSGSLFMYAGDHGGAFAKNSFGNLYTAVGVFVLGRTLQEAWGAQAAEKQKEFNTFLERERLCISMELVTAVLGDHGQRPLKDYVVVTAVTDLKSKPLFYSTADLVAFCRKWRLPTNHLWLFSSRKSATSFFTAYDALCEEGTATSVTRSLDQIADVSVPATKSHMEVQGEILEGLVTRIVSPRSAERLLKVLKEFPPFETKGGAQFGPSLREICATNYTNEWQQVKALLQYTGLDMCPDWSDWNSNRTNSSLFNLFLNAAPADQMTTKLQEMLQVLQKEHMQVRYPCRVKGIGTKEGKTQFKLTVHVLNDHVFRRYQKLMRNISGLWPLYRGFFVDIFLFHGQNQGSLKPVVASLSDNFQNNMHVNNGDDDALADEAENLMVKLKFLTYKIRTFLIRNGLDVLFNSGFAAYRKYYFRQMEIWGTSPNKQRQLDRLLSEWAQYILEKCNGRKLNDHIYLSEGEPFLKRFGARSLLNRQLVGPPRSIDTSEEVGEFINASHGGQHVNEDAYQAKAPIRAEQLPRVVEMKGMIVFFPGIPGCAKSSLCKELLKVKGLGAGKPVKSLMGDLIKGRYWPKLAEEQQRHPYTIMLADKNAPNQEVWKTVKEICQSTHSIGVPVVPDSEGAISNPFSLETLAVFIYRVIKRVNHPGNLDHNSKNAGYVLLMFYNLYEGKNRREFEGNLEQHFGYVVRQPVLRPHRASMPSSVLGILIHGLDLFRRHSARHGRLDSTKGAFQEEWSMWENQLREILFGNAEHLTAIQVPFEQAVQSVQEQLQAIAQGDASMHAPVESERRFNSIAYAALSLPPKEVIDLLHQISFSNKHVQMFISGKRIDTTLKQAHVTLAHKISHGVAAVAAYGELQGFSVPVQLTALLFSEKMCAIEVHISANKQEIKSENEWPHVTVWTAPGTRPKEANFLPQLVSQGNASRVDLPTPVVISGVLELL